MQAPQWWYVITGTFAVLGSMAFIVAMVASIVLSRILLDVRDNLRSLNERVKTLGDRVDGVVSSVQDITTEVGTRTKGIVRVVDEHANTAFTIIEKLAPLALGIGVIARIIAFAKSRK